MISKLTQLLGEMCLILSKNRAAYRYAVVKKSRPQNSQSGGKFSQILLLLLISFIGFNNKAFAQCSPDTVFPDAVCVFALTASLDSDGEATITIQDIDNGSSDFCGIVDYSLSQSTFDCDDVGSNQQVILTVTDAAGNSNTCNTFVQVRDQLAPAITCPANVTVDCGDPITTTATGDATAIDNCTASTISFNDANATTTTTGSCQTIERTFTAEDNANPSNSNTCVQTIEVIDNEDPVLDFGMGIVAPGDTTLSCSELVPPAITATMTDDCTPSSTITATEVSSQSTDPLMCEFYNYTITRTWTATDNCGRTDAYSQTITIEDDPEFNGAPTTLNLSANSTVDCPSSCSAEINLDLTNDLVYDCGQVHRTSFSVEDLMGNILYSGPGLVVNSICVGVGVYNANFMALDYCGNTTTHTVVVTIEDNQPPNAVCINSINIAVPSNGVYTIDPLAIIDNGSTDNCATQLDYSVDVTTLDCSLMGQAIGDVVTVTMTVSDGTLTSTCSTDITILDNPPAPFCQDITVALDASGNYTVQAMDIDNGSVDQCNGPLSFLISEDSTTFAATLPLDCTDLGMVPVVLQVTDSGAPAMSAICYANITVEDDLDPNAICGFTTYPVTLNSDGTYQFNASDSTAFQNLFSDNCDFTTSASISSFDCSDVDVTGGVDVTISVVDDNGMLILDSNGDSINCVVNIDVSDSTPPIIDCADITVSVDESGDLVLSPEDVIGGSLYLQSGNNGSGTSGFNTICIDAANATTFSFDYAYTTMDLNGTNADGFGYYVNGTLTEVVGPSVFLPSPISINLNAGDELCFYINTSNNNDGSATVIMDNFSSGLIGDFAIVNWDAPSSSNSDGSIFFNDACGIDNYQIRLVGDLMWSDSLIYDCSSINTLFGNLCNEPTEQFEVRAFDVNGNESLVNCTSNVTFIDKHPPVPVCEAKTISLSTGAVDVPAELFDDGSYDACGTIDINRYAIARPADGIFQQELTFDCDSVGVFPLTFRVEDCAGNQAFCSTTITVQENQPPKINCSPNITIDCTQSVDPTVTGFPLLVMDACSANVDTTYTDVYDGPADACSVISRTWTATDASGNQNSCLQLITVEDNIAPTYTVPADITLENCEDPDDFFITGIITDAADQCDIRVGASFHDAGFFGHYDIISAGGWNFTSASSGMGTFSPGTVFTYGQDSIQIIGSQEFACNNPGMDTIQNNYEITIISDGDLRFQWCYESADSTGTGNDDPFGYILNGTFTQLSGSASSATGLETLTVEAGDVFAFSQQTNTSSCGGAMTTIKNFRGPHGCTSTFVRTWNVFDDCGNNNIQYQNITIDKTSAPTITFPTALQAVSDGSGNCSANATVDFSNAVTGNCGSIEITNDALVNFGVGDGMLDASGSYPVGDNIVTYTVSSPEGCFMNQTHQVTVTVVDGTSPFLTCTQSIQNVILNSSGQGVLSNTTSLYSAFDDCGIANVLVNPVNFDCSDIGTTPNVTLTVTDASGNSNSCNLNVNVIASSTTSLVCPADVTVDCAAFAGITGDYGMPASGDVCGTGSTVVISNSLVSGTFDDCFVFDRVWSNGVNTCTQTITVEDLIAPELEAAPNDTTLTFSNPNLPTSLSFTDNCTADGSVTSIDDTSDQGTDPCTCDYYNYDITRYWLAFDACGNMDSLAQIITIEDDSIPTFTFPDTLFINNDPGICGAQLDLEISDYIHDDALFTCLSIRNDGLANYGNGNGTTDIDGYYPVGEYEIEFEVIDPCGNTATETLLLHILDSESFSLPCFSFIDLNLDNTGNASITEAQVLNGTIVDNCAPSTFTYSLSNSNFDCSDLGPFNTTTLTVTDQNGNQNSCTVNVNVLSTFISAGFSATISSTPATNILSADGTASVVVTGGSGSFTYLWNDTNASTTSTVTGLNPGLYTVIVTDTNTGCELTDEVVVATLCPTFTIGQANGGTGDALSIPVTIDNFTNVVSFQFTLNVDPAVAQFTGASGFAIPGLTAANFSVIMSGGGVITVSWIDPNGAPGTTLPTGTPLFNLDFTLTGTAGNASLVAIDNSATAPVNYEVGQFLNGLAVSVPGCSNDGSISVNTSLSLSRVCGNIATENGTPVENVEVFETGSTAMSDTTDVNGNYCLDIAPGTPVCLEPFKNYNHFGSSSIDLYLIQQHILGNTLLTSPYQVIAADANNSGSVSTLDLVDLQFLILGNYTMLPNNDFWRFVDANQTFTNPLAPFPFDEKINLGTVNMDMLNNNFIAVAIGDVNGTAQVQMTDGTTDVRTNNSFDLQLDDQAIKKGETFEVTFNASEFADIAGYQMTLEFGKEAMQFEAVEALHIDNLKESNFALNYVNDGLISLNWYGMQTRDFKDAEALFTLKFTALNDIETLQGLLRSTSVITNAEAYKMTNNELEYLNVNLTFNENTVVTTDFALFDNIPNPFRNETMIGFMLPNDSETTITVFDATGKILMQVNRDFYKGYNEMTINASELGNSGILYYEVKTKENTATGRMILLK